MQNYFNELSSGQSLPKNFKLRHYTIKSLIATDAESFTYIARDENHHRFVIIKELFLLNQCLRNQSTGEVYLSHHDHENLFHHALLAFQEESITLGRLTSPGLPQIFHFFPENDTAYRVNASQKSDSLKTIMNDKHKRDLFLEEADIRRLLWCILDVLISLKKEKLNHFNLSPENIFINTLKNPLLSHICSFRDKLGELPMLGDSSTPYSAPEQWTTDEIWNDQTDMYSVGAIFYELITGSLPQQADLRRKNAEHIPLMEISALREFFSPNLMSSIDKSLSLNPKDRFNNYRDWQQTLLKQKKFSAPHWMGGKPKSRKWIWRGAALFLLGGLTLSGWVGFKLIEAGIKESQPEAVKSLVTSIATPEHNLNTQTLWGFIFTLNDRGFGVYEGKITPTVTLKSLELHPDYAQIKNEISAVKLCLRDKDGTPLALSENEVKLSPNQTGPISFQFKTNTILNSTIPYEFILITPKGALLPIPLITTEKSPVFSASSGLYTEKIENRNLKRLPSLKASFEPQSGLQALQKDNVASTSLPNIYNYASPQNWLLHPGTITEQSSIDGNSASHLAVDGQFNSSLGALTKAEQTPGWWSAQFGEGIQRPIKTIVVYNIENGELPEARNLSNYRITLFDINNQELIHKDFHTEPQSWVKNISEAWELPETVQAHSLRIEKLGKGAAGDQSLFLSEVEVLAPDSKEISISPELKNLTNLAGVNARQSSTLKNWNATYGAHQAINQKKSGPTYSQTETDNTLPWWELTFPKEQALEIIRIFNVESTGLNGLRLSNFAVRLYDAQDNLIWENKYCTTPGDSIRKSLTIALPKIMKAQKLRIEKLGKGTHPQDNALSISEVEVFGKAP